MELFSLCKWEACNTVAEIHCNCDFICCKAHHSFHSFSHHPMARHYKPALFDLTDPDIGSIEGLEDVLEEHYSSRTDFLRAKQKLHTDILVNRIQEVEKECLEEIDELMKRKMTC